MLSRQRPSGKKLAIVFSVITGLALLIGSASVLYASAPRSSAASPKSFSRSLVAGHGAVSTGEVNLATLPKATSKDLAAAAAAGPKSVSINRHLKTPAQRAALAQWNKTHAASLPHATGQKAPAGGSLSPNFVGTSTVPVLVSQADGINFTQSGCGCTPPDQALAAAPGYVFEGVNNLLEVFTPTYAQKFGPWTAATFFAPVKHASTFFSDPQITFDAERAKYLIAWLEVKNDLSADWIDIAVSTTSTPSPLTSFREYSIPATSFQTDDFCDYPTLGYDFWGMYVSCVDFTIAGAFKGNSTYLFNINGLLANAIGTYWGALNVPTDLGGNPPAFRLSPTIEDGVPMAEWIIATDAGYGVLSSNLTLCALTNTHALISNLPPTYTCGFNSLPLAYDDPQNAVEPGGHVLDPGAGTKQIAYRNGRLYFALAITINCGGTVEDGIAWYDVVPQVTTLAAFNPQHVNGIVSAYSEANYWCFTNADSFMPTLHPGHENDMALVFNFSSSSIFPGIGYSGRMAADAPNDMGQGLNFGIVLFGSSSNTTGRWGDYSACALTTNLVTRGTLFCAGEYGGADVWNTRLYQLRME
jgi:hypothetical protein